MSRKKKMLKVLSGIIGIILIGGILFITNAFVGNPVSAVMANRSIERYVDENYSFLDLELEKAIYNFKDGAYMVRAKSKTSVDTKFPIYYRRGEVIRDGYDTYVLNKFNTLQRLSDEYSYIAKDIIAKELGYKDNTTMVMLDREEERMNDLELDMNFERGLPIEAEVLIRLDLNSNSMEEIAKVLTDAHQAFIENDCNFSKYSLYSEVEQVYVSVHEVTPEDIESDQLKEILEEATKHETINGVRVLIKGE